jgi:hypothetical protein
MTEIVPTQNVQGRIYRIRGQQVMLDQDLAEVYAVPTKSFNLAVRRNAIRFPEDFMFQMSFREAADLRFQIETSSWGGVRQACGSSRGCKSPAGRIGRNRELRPGCLPRGRI